jgi:hypothetical protein
VAQLAITLDTPEVPPPADENDDGPDTEEIRALLSPVPSMLPDQLVPEADNYDLPDTEERHAVKNLAGPTLHTSDASSTLPDQLVPEADNYDSPDTEETNAMKNLAGPILDTPHIPASPEHQPTRRSPKVPRPQPVKKVVHFTPNDGESIFIKPGGSLDTNVRRVHDDDIEIINHAPEYKSILLHS